MKCEEAGKYFQSKLIQNKWEEELKRDRELLELANKIPDEDILQDFNILMQAVKQQCAISMINQELVREGKHPVPDINLPEKFPKSTAKRKYSGNITFSIENNLCSSLEKKYQKSSNVIFHSMPNIYADVITVSDSAAEDFKIFPERPNSNRSILEEKMQNAEEFSIIPTSFKTSKIRKYRCRNYTSKTLSRLFPNKISQAFQSLSTPNLYYKRLSMAENACDKVLNCYISKDREEIDLA